MYGFFILTIISRPVTQIGSSVYDETGSQCLMQLHKRAAKCSASLSTLGSVLKYINGYTDLW